MESLSAYADGECGLIEALRVRLHLLGCAGCRQWLRQVREDQRRFRETYLHSARGADITAGVMQEVRKMPVTQGAQHRRGVGSLAVAFVAVGGIAATMVIVAAMIMPTFSRTREKARQTSCLSNMKQLALGIEMFAKDHEGRLPGAVTWAEDIRPYVQNKQIFECPERPRGEKGGYAINALVAGKKLDDIPDKATTVLLPTRNYGLAEKLKLAYEATIEVWVENVYQALLQAEAAVHKCGGFLLSSQLEARHDSARASMIVKVPTAEVGNCINALGALGFVARRQITGEDLTERHVSATREIGTKTERQERLGEMVETMKSDKQRVAAEQNLGQVEGETQSLSDTLYHIDTRVTLATISATLLEREAEREPVQPSVLNSFRGAALALWALLLRLGAVAAWLIVFAPLWGTAIIVAYALRRRAPRRGE